MLPRRRRSTQLGSDTDAAAGGFHRHRDSSSARDTASGSCGETKAAAALRGRDPPRGTSGGVDDSQLPPHHHQAGPGARRRGVENPQTPSLVQTHSLVQHPPLGAILFARPQWLLDSDNYS
ncbi:unnamed protein product [Lampetra planeri]